MQVTIALNEKTQRFTIHAPRCGHTERDHYSDVFDADVVTVKDLVDACYGPERGSYYLEAGIDENSDTAWQEYGGMECLAVAPCAKRMMKAVA